MWLRHPKTTQERRYWEYTKDLEREFGVRIRARTARSNKCLVHAWDDTPRHIDRSWKRHRKTQYRPTFGQ